MNVKQINTIFFLCGFSVVSLFQMIPVKVQAQAEGRRDNTIRYVDKVVVRFRDGIYVDQNPYDDIREWAKGSSSCQDIARDSRDDNNQENVGQVIIREPRADGSCPGEDDAATEKIDNVQMTFTDKKNINGYRINAETLFLPIGLGPIGCGIQGNYLEDSLITEGDRLTGRGRFYRRLPPADREPGQDDEYLLLNDNGTLNNRAKIITGGGGAADVRVTGECGGIGDTHTFNDIVVLSGTPIPAEYQVDTASDIPRQGGGGGSGGGTAPEADPTCESENTQVLDWILCGTINAIDKVLVGKDGTGGLFGEVDDLLNISSQKYDNPKLKESWSYFRNIASLALVVIGLVMVVGQALSKE